MRIRLAAAIAALAIAAASCGADTEAPSVAREVGPVPVPAGEVVLTVSGAVDQPNVGDEVHADLEGLESLGTVDVVIFEPFISEEVMFTGVPLETVLHSFGVDAATPLVWRALDSYEVNYSLADLEGEGAILATRQDGGPIGIADGGPIRIIFTESDGELGQNTNEWIWSLAHVDVG